MSDDHQHDRRGQLDRSICGGCNDAYVECSACGIYACSCDAPTPTQRAAPQGGDVEALAEALTAIETDWLDADDARQFAAGLLASDWLAAHDAEVRASAARETAERIAGAIEARRLTCYADALGESARNALTIAATIARAEGDR